MRSHLRRMRRIVATSGTVAAAVLLGVAPTTATVAQAVTAHPMTAPVPLQKLHRFQAPPTQSDCVSVGLLCYTPQQMQTAYNMGPLYGRGDTGKGKKILVVDSFGSPTIQHDLDVFSKAFHLPHTHIKIIQPSGKVPPYDPTNGDVFGWAVETTLDVELAHTMAPGAQIVLAETPVSETEGLQGFPEMMHAEKWAMDHHLADVISQSFGTGEASFKHPKSDIESVRFAFKQAARQHVTVLAASGDSGAANFNGSTTQGSRQASWPASDPLVTSVGGTQITLDAKGHRVKADEVWNESALFSDSVAGGGGRSAVFSRPWYQHNVTREVHGSRGYPDISMNAAVFESPILYWSFKGEGFTPGFIIGIGGTSAATPLFAGFVAVADQANGHNLGLLNPSLYRLHDRRHSGEVDVTIGNNNTPAVKGWYAKRGYDLASGWGTINGAKLARSLSRY